MKVNERFTAFESNVMEMLLKGDDIILHTLYNQFCYARIDHREFTGVGFFTYFTTPDIVTRLEPPISFNLGDLVGHIEGMNDQVGFLLYVRNGVVYLLEGYTYGEEEWPELIDGFHLSYIPDGKRDFDKVKLKWLGRDMI